MQQLRQHRWLQAEPTPPLARHRRHLLVLQAEVHRGGVKGPGGGLGAVAEGAHDRVPRGLVSVGLHERVRVWIHLLLDACISLDDGRDQSVGVHS